MTIDIPEKMFHHAVTTLKTGGVIAYPTEAVYGLGCDPFNEQAVKRILEIKNRPISKGMILIASSWEQLAFMVKPLDAERMQRIFATWPGPFTWIFPASTKAPEWVCVNKMLAVRVTAHPQAKALCEHYGGAIVSTSANKTNEPPANSNLDVLKIFNDEVDYILPGRVGDLTKPTQISDAITGKVIR